MKLVIENVRSFSGRHEIPIKPFTLLVGENSSGKTTALACLAIASELANISYQTKFKLDPYDLGGFDAIVARKPKKESQFGIGVDFSDGADPDKRGDILAKFTPGDTGMPELAALEGSIDAERFAITIEGKTVAVYISSLKGKRVLGPVDALAENAFEKVPFILLLSLLFREMQNTEPDALVGPLVPEIPVRVRKLLDTNTVSLAPVRTKPRSIYEPADDSFSPEGDHIPYVLARLFHDANGSENGTTLSEALGKFGKDSGLFRDVRVVRMGQTPGAPFRVMINIANLPVNLPYVGYGISQSLPIVVDSVEAPAGSRILMQQPEVHLHPRGQAALASLLMHLAASEQKEFVIETHSDHIINRVRMEVARGTIPSESVQILYFEKEGALTTVHPIHLDDMANVMDAPPSYRKFFLQEELALMTRGR